MALQRCTSAGHMDRVGIGSCAPCRSSPRAMQAGREVDRSVGLQGREGVLVEGPGPSATTSPPSVADGGAAAVPAVPHRATGAVADPCIRQPGQRSVERQQHHGWAQRTTSDARLPDTAVQCPQWRPEVAPIHQPGEWLHAPRTPAGLGGSRWYIADGSAAWEGSSRCPRGSHSACGRL